jgi:dihydrofolate reductase
MGKLIYAAIASLDGYVADVDGRFEWCAPDAEVHLAVNEVERPVGTHLYGRRMYDVLQVWETIDTGPDQEPAMRDFAQIWRAADKIVYSRTLDTVPTARTRIERELDPEAVRRLKAATTSDLSIGGPEVAAVALRAGLVDEIHLFLAPVLVGGGNPALPDGLRLDLELVGVRRFDSGFVHLHHAVRSP